MCLDMASWAKVKNLIDFSIEVTVLVCIFQAYNTVIDLRWTWIISRLVYVRERVQI
jgi:hypothetical protein